ncbi:MAG: vWA domain-containing protein [Moheibacter sp.]
MKTLFVILGSVVTFFTMDSIVGREIDQKQSEREIVVEKLEEESPTAQEKIQVALLLDTSSSMDGLIEQAKSRLWNIVNTMTTLRYDGKRPNIEISLYEYGNDGLSVDGGFIRQVTPLTSDLDLLSEKLFALRTYGGSEFCGKVIQTSTSELDWDGNKNSMKLIYIAGNEPFTQGEVSYVEAISDAVGKGIYVNTIHCGDSQTGISEKWKDGADKGKGEYFVIDHNQKIIYIPTPFDVRIDDCNTRLNSTYIYYGNEGDKMKERQVMQDAEAEEISMENKVTRAAAKANYNYSNAGWDLVDALSQNKITIKELDKNTLPNKYQNMSEAQLKREIENMTVERSKIQKEILELNTERENYIQTELAKRGEGGTDLGKAITDAVVKFAVAKGYTQEK